MKLTRIIVTSLLLAFAFNVNAQKVKIKKDIAYVDGEEYVKVEKEDGNMSIYSLDEEEELVYLKWYDPTPGYQTSRSAQGDGYYIVRFIEFDVEVELDETRKKIIKMLYKGKVIQNGKIDEEKLKNFVSKYGSDESKGKLYIRN